MFEDPDQSSESLSEVERGSIFHTVRHVAVTRSTNADVADWARQGAEEGTVLVADAQTAGRGRRERVWISPPGTSVSMSLLLRPVAEFADWGWLSLLAGMAVAGALRTFKGAGERVTVKWPNDVLIDGRKVCGILSECVASSSGPAAVVGIGINLALADKDLPVPGTTSLAIAGLPHDRDEVIDAVLFAFDRLYRDWLHLGPPVDAYIDLCSSIGASLTINIGEEERVTGVGEGIDSAGRLLVRSSGRLFTFAAGDVVHAALS